MTDPSSPNYKPGVGRLTTDRFDFQNHVVGTDFQHKAISINLVPPITVDGFPYDNLQNAIDAIAVLVPQIIPDATSVTKGLILLAGDVAGSGGTADSIRVGGLQGRGVSTLAPNDLDVLTWDSGLSVWKPQAINTSPTFADLTVTNSSNLYSLIVTGGFDIDGASNSHIGCSSTLTIDPQDLDIDVPSTTFITCPAITISTSTLDIQGSTSFSSHVFFNGNTTIGDLSFTDTLLVNSITSFNQTATFFSDATIKQTLIFSSSTGRLIHNAVIANNANQNFNIRQYKYIVVPTTNTATRSYYFGNSNSTTGTSGMVDGDWFQISNYSSYSITVSGVISGSISSGQWKKYIRIGGTFTQVSDG